MEACDEILNCQTHREAGAEPPLQLGIGEALALRLGCCLAELDKGWFGCLVAVLLGLVAVSITRGFKCDVFCWLHRRLLERKVLEVDELTVARDGNDAFILLNVVFDA